jgi:hypothetical protein
MDGGLETILKNPLAVTAVIALLFVCWGPLLADVLKKRRKRHHRAEFRAVEVRWRLIADYEAACCGLTGEALCRRTEQFVQSLQDRDATVLSKYLARRHK